MKRHPVAAVALPGQQEIADANGCSLVLLLLPAVATGCA